MKCSPTFRRRMWKVIQAEEWRTRNAGGRQEGSRIHLDREHACMACDCGFQAAAPLNRDFQVSVGALQPRRKAAPDLKL